MQARQRPTSTYLASLNALAYARAVEWIARELRLLSPLLVVFAAPVICSIAGFAFAPMTTVMLIHLVNIPLRMVRMIITASSMIQIPCVLKE